MVIIKKGLARVVCCALASLPLSVPLVQADAGQSNSDAYEEVYLNLDEETKQRGAALYTQHCAACHDGNVVRAPSATFLSRARPKRFSPR